jgi:superfamily II DNA or RNA helicase
VARHYPSEPRVAKAVERLSDQFLQHGSVNAVAEALTTALGQAPGLPRIYPNRIHGLLSGDPTRSINTATLDAIERGLDQLEAAPADGPGERARIQQEILTAFAAHQDDDPLQVAETLDFPAVIVRMFHETGPASPAPKTRPAVPATPDWSWQETAFKASLRALRKGPNAKAGLILPTGAGKTRVGLRVILRWLGDDERDDTVALWVTHRKTLKRQARRELQQVLKEHRDEPESAAALFNRVEFVMISDLATALTKHAGNVTLVVVDEAHHAAAPSYQSLFTDVVAPGLFLTATPNRSDKQSIGIDEVAYTITYRELFERGCVIEPIFDPPLDLYGLDWTSPSGLRDLADYLLERTEGDYTKILVAVSRQERASILYEAIVDLLDERPAHPLAADDVGFVHGSASSNGVDPSDFLDEFAGRPTGILVATSQLIGEGFDDPSIDAVVTTYPSESISHLMQVAGRALRFAPGKQRAHVVQVRESKLQYHFHQRWLYQDISDQLRPELVDLTYGSAADLEEKVIALLARHRVSSPTQARILSELGGIEPGDDVRLMLTGVPFYSSADAFQTDAEWGAILVTAAERSRFREIFNDISIRTEDVKEHTKYLQNHLPPSAQKGSLWKSYVDLVPAMEFARREINGVPYADEANRGYHKGLHTTWLRYVTLTFAPAVPQALDDFVRDAVNREAVLHQYLEAGVDWAAAVRLELPLTGSVAYLLDGAQAEWLEEQRRAVIERLALSGPGDGFDVVAAWAGALPAIPLPARIIAEFRQLLRPERLDQHYLALGPLASTY